MSDTRAEDLIIVSYVFRYDRYINTEERQTDNFNIDSQFTNNQSNEQYTRYSNSGTNNANGVSRSVVMKLISPSHIDSQLQVRRLLPVQARGSGRVWWPW